MRINSTIPACGGRQTWNGRKIHTLIQAVDKLRLQMNIACMAQKFLALLLIISWISLSGFDVLEDLDFPVRVELYSSTASPLLDHGQTARLTHNIVESAGQSRLCYSSLMEQPAAQLLICSPTLPHRTYKLHKLHHAFLI
jgi:hypothetical protein